VRHRYPRANTDEDAKKKLDQQMSRFIRKGLRELEEMLARHSRFEEYWRREKDSHE